MTKILPGENGKKNAFLEDNAFREKHYVGA